MVVSFSAESPGLDWPHFRGPNRDGVSTESGLLNHWPKEGPRLLWSAEALGIGHSSVAVSKGTIYVTGMNDENEGVLTAFDLVGKEKWKKTYGPEWTGGHKGVRCTPTVTDGYVYIRTGVGRVVCLDAGSGELKWEVNDKLRFEGEYSGGWGYSDSILIDGDIVICSPGGPDATLVALDKSTGKTVWTSNGLSDSAAYCAPILIARGDSRQIVTVLKTSVVGLDPANGKTLWKQNYQGGRNISPNSPLYADGEIYITSGYDHGGLKVRLSEDGKQATRLWEDETLDTHHGGVVLVSGYIYGSNWLNNPKGQWVCLDWKTGKPQYETAWEGNKGSIITADGMLYCYGEDGIVALVKPDPKEFKIVSSFEITQGSDNHWAHPAISDARLYIRHGDALMVYDIKPPS
jgi:outer membrane protein assembly factor BamB